jgi:hypothetical protein
MHWLSILNLEILYTYRQLALISFSVIGGHKFVGRFEMPTLVVFLFFETPFIYLFPMISSLLVVFFFFETLFHFFFLFLFPMISSHWYWVSWEDKEKKGKKQKTKNLCKTLCSVKPMAMGFTSIGHTLGSTFYLYFVMFFFGFLEGQVSSLKSQLEKNAHGMIGYMRQSP